MKKKMIGKWGLLLSGVLALVSLASTRNFVYAEDTDTKDKPTLQTKEEYQIPEGEVYVYGASDKKYSNTAEKNAINQAIEAIVKANKTEAIIVVSGGTYEGGIEVDYKKDSPLKLSIVSDDSFEKVKDKDDDNCIPSTTTDGVTTYTFNSSSSGSVVLLGGIQTKNVSLTLAGIHLGNTLKESIDDVGSKDIDVTGGAGFKYYATSVSDKANVSLTHVGGEITIDLGDGNDELDFKLVKKPTETLSYKSAKEDITSDDWADDITTKIQTTLSNIAEPDKEKITITGGDGNDTISSMVMNSSDITIDDDNGLSLLMDVTPVDLTIESGDGSDRVSVGGGVAMSSLKVIALQAAYNALYSMSNTAYESNITVELGAGDDYCDVISTISYISFSPIKCEVTGSYGFDHVNLDGKLGAKDSSVAVISGTSDDLSIKTLAEVSIFEAASVAEIYSSAVLNIDSEAITDTLSGKKSVNVFQMDGNLYDKGTNLKIDIDSFTDYVIDDYDDSKSINITASTGLLLSNVVIEADTNLELGNITVPNTLLATVADSGENSEITIKVNGIINANNVLIRAENSDSHSLAIISSDLDSESDAEIEASCFDVTSSINLEILTTAEINAENIFDILLSSEQTQGLLPTANGLTAGAIADEGTNPNFVVVKVSDVEINVYGKITAASIRIVAESNVETESQNQALKDFGVPVAVGVVCTNAKINIDSNKKEIKSDNGITIIAKSDDSLSVTAMTGLLPFTLSTAVVVNNASIDVVDDSILTAKTDIVLYSSSDVITRTISTGTSDGSKLVTSSTVDTSASGGFFTVSVVLSDVHTEISGSAKITADGDLYVLSDSSQDIVNEATSNPESEGDSKSLVDIVDDLKKTFTKAKKNKIFTKKNAQEGLTLVINKLTGEKDGVKNLFNSSTSGATEEEEDDEEDDNSSSSSADTNKKKESGENQLVGALAVTYTDNTNKAIVKDNVVLKIEGTANVKANGSVSILTLADGSPVKRTSKASGSDNKEKVETPEEKKTNAITNGIVSVDACDNGTVTIKNESVPDAAVEDGNEVSVKIEAEAGYKIKTCVIKEEGKSDDTPSNVVGKESAEFSIIPNKKTQIVVSFEEKEIELVCENTDTSLYTLTAYKDSGLETVTAHADKGEKVYVSAKCKGGVSLKGINFKYQKNGATIKGSLEKSNGVYTYTLPKGSYYTVTFTAEVELTELTLETKETGSVSGNKVDFYNENRKSITKANVGDKVTLEIVCVEGSYLKKDGLKLGDEVLPVKVEGKTYSTELTIKYIKSTPDQFKVNVEFTSKESEAEGYTAKKKALGVGVNVNVTTYSNVAKIDLNKDSEIGNLDVEAITSKHDIEAIAKAGFTAADFGLAGTVSVNVISSETLAEVYHTRIVTFDDDNDGKLNVKSSVEESKAITIADAGGVDADGTSKSDDGIGVGAGIGVQVVGVDVLSTVEISEIDDNASLGDFNVSSSFSGKENLLSKAGASGGKAVVPVLSLDVSGVYVESKVDINNNNSTYESVTIDSSNSVERNLTADANAVGASVAAGGSFVISVINDSALTTVDASFKANKDIKATSSSESSATLEAKAGANGAKEDEDSDKEGSEKNLSEENAQTDKTVDANLTGAGSIAGAVNSKNTNTSNTTDAQTNRQKAETSEGNVSVAASVTVNVMNNKAITEIGDYVTWEANGTADDDDDTENGIITTSTVDTDAVISANSSTANSGKGVAVGVAVNVVNYDNKVILGDGTYKTNADMTVKAIIKDKEVEDKTAELFTDLANKLLEVFNAKELADVLVCDEKDSFKEYVIAIALELDFTQEALSSKLEGDDATVIDSLVAAIVERIKCGISGDDFDDTILEEYQTLAEEVMVRIIAKFKNGTAINNILSKSADVRALLSTAQGNMTDKDKWKEVLNSALTALAYVLGSDDELDGVGSKISTSAISGAGAASVGVAGSLAISVVNADTATTIAPGSEATVSGKLVLNADAAQTIFTTATASVNREGKADKNKTTTDASAATNNGASNNSTASSKDSKKSVGVGASVAIAFGDLNVYSGIGYNDTFNDGKYDSTKVTANSLDIRAISRNDADTIAVSGSDPLASAEDGKTEKLRNEIAVDASVSVAILNNNVHTFVGEGASIYLNEDNCIESPIANESVNFLIYSKESGSTVANASGFAVGGQTAVGAAVAVNLALGDVDVTVDGSVSSDGDVLVACESVNHDDAKALALAMGADIDRYTDKMNQMKVLTQKKEQAASSKSTDSSSGKEVKTSTTTGDKITDNLNKNTNDKSTKADSSKTLSQSVLQSENVKTESVNQTEDDDLNNAIGDLFGDDTNSSQNKEEKKETLDKLVNGKNNDNNSSTDSNNNNNNNNENSSSSEATPADSVENGMNGNNVSEDAKQSKSITIAAAVGVNITSHDLLVVINGEIEGKNVTISSSDNGNFSTISTGAAVTLADNSNSIGAAVAVSVNHNESIIEIYDYITADKDITITSNTKSNLDGTYGGKYGALAIAGAASGKGGSATVAGAITVMVADTTTRVFVADGVYLTSNNYTNGNVNILANDKTKMNTGAIAATLSKGTTVGVGAAFALLYAENDVSTEIGSKVRIIAGSVSIKAVKEKVTIQDYNSPFKASEILSIKMDTTEVTDSDGIIVVTEKDGKYDVTINAQTDDISTAAQLTSALGTGNYSALAIAGTIIGSESSSKAAVAGSIAMLFDYSSVTVIISNDVYIKAYGSNIDILSQGDNNGILIGGAASVSSATAGVGVNVGIAVCENVVETLISDNVDISSLSEDVTINSTSDNDIVAVSIAAAVSGTNSKATIGGGITVIVAKDLIFTDIGNECYIYGGNDVKIFSINDSNMDVISMSAAVQKSETGSVAAGGTVDVIVSKNRVKVNVGKKNNIYASDGDLRILANNDENLVSVLGSVSVATAAASAAATVDVLVTSSEALVVIDDSTEIRADGDVYILANGESRLIGVQLAAAVSGSKGPAVGATILVNVFNRKLYILIDDKCNITSNYGSVLISSNDDEKTVLVSIDAAVSTGSSAIAGNIQANVGRSYVHTEIGNEVKIYAGNSIAILANLNSVNVQVAPSASVSLGSVGVGATVVVTVLRNTVEAITQDNVVLYAYNNDSSHTISVEEGDSSSEKRGIILGANINNKTAVCGIGVSVSSGAAISGVIDTVVVRNVCRARMGNSNSATVNGSSDDSEGDSCGLIVEAYDNSFLLNFGGAVSAAATTGVGATVVTLAFDSEVEAVISDDSTIDSNGCVAVIANNEYELYLVGVSFSAGLSGASVGAGGSVLIYGNKTHAAIGGTIEADGNIKVEANAKSTLLNASAAVAVNNVAVSGAAVVTYLEGETIAEVIDNSSLEGNKISVIAISNEDIVTEGVGVSGGAGVAVSGIVDVMVNGIDTEAYTGENVYIDADGVVEISAEDNYALDAVVASAALGGTTGVGVTAVVTVAKNKVVGNIGAYNDISSDENVIVSANSDRRVLAVAGTVGAGATAGIGATVMVTVIGSKLDEDSSEAITDSFDREAFMKDMSSNSSAAGDYYKNRDLSELDGSGIRPSDTTVGSVNEDGKYEYNATEGYDTSNSSYQQGTNKDQENAKNISLGMNSLEKTDSTIVTVGKNSAIKASNEVKILATDNLVIDNVTASVAGGGLAGVGVGVAVAIANSNIFAFVESNVNINCTSFDLMATGTSVSDSVNSDINDIYKDATNHEITNPSIHVISASGAASGTAGVGVAVAVVSLTSDIEAVFNGYQINANGDVSITANSIYEGIIAATLGFGAGSVGVSASVAVADYSGYTLASIASSAIISTDGDVSVATETLNSTETVAVAIAGGGVAVNGGVSVALNSNTSETYIYQGAVINTCGNVVVYNNTKADANAYLLGASIGAVDVGLSAGVSIVRPMILTYIGYGPIEAAKGKTVDRKGRITANTVAVNNTIESNSETTILSLAGGGVAINGNVLLVFNDTLAYASINSMNISASDLYVISDSEVYGESYLASAVAGGVSVGISVSYVGLDFANYSMLVYDDCNIEISNLYVYAGNEDDNNVASAIANTLIANSGAIAANLNAAIADNNSINMAYCYGTGNLIVKNDVEINAFLDSKSNAKISGLSDLIDVSGVSVNAGTSIAINRATNEAYLAGDFDCDTIYVYATINYEKNHNTKAELYQGQAATVVAVTASVAVAYEQVSNKVTFVTNKSTASNTIDVFASGTAKSEAIAGNLNSVSGVSAAVLVAYAYTNSTFLVDFTAKKVATEELYVGIEAFSYAQSDVTPSKGGAISISVGSVKTNVAYAETNGTYDVVFNCNLATATLELDVYTEIIGDAVANVNSVAFEAGVVNVTTNVAEAYVIDTLSTRVDSSGTIDTFALFIYNFYNKDYGLGVDSGFGAKALVGGNDISNVSGKVSFIDVTTNVANAYNYINNELVITGNPNISVADAFIIKAYTNGNVEAKTESSTISGSFSSIGNMETDALVADKTKVELNLGKAVCTDSDIEISAVSVSGLTSSASAPMVSVSALSEASVNATGSIGTKDNKALASLILNSGDLYADNIDIEAVYLPSKNEIGVNAGTNVSGLAISVNSLETKTYIKSYLDLGSVSLHATEASENENNGSRIFIRSEASPKANLAASGDNIGIALAVSDITVKNIAVTESDLVIGDNFTAYSTNQIEIVGASSAYLSSYASGLTGGVVAGSGITVANNVERTINVSIGENANVYAYGAGDAIVIGAIAGENDNVSGLIDDTVAGLVGISAAKALTDIKNNQLVSIGKNSYYMALNGSVTIESNYGIKKINNKVDSTSAGLASGMVGKANTTITIKSQLEINYSDVDGDDFVYIVGQYANVLNYASKWNVNNELNMSNDAVTGNVSFENELTVNLDVNNYISGCFIDGIVEAYLTASFMTPNMNDESNFKSNNSAKVSLALVSTDAIKNACTDFWKNSNSSVNGKIVMNIGTVELYSTRNDGYFTGSGYNKIGTISYTSNVNINNGGYTANNVLASNLTVDIKQRKNQDGYAFLYFKNASRNVAVVDITNNGAIIRDNYDSVSVSKNVIENGTIYLGELKANMSQYSGYYKCDLSDLYIINRSDYNVCFDIITNTNNSNFPRGTISLQTATNKNVSILGQHDDYQSYHLYADWLGEEGGYLNLGSSADVSITINGSDNEIYGVASSYITEADNVVTIDLSNLTGNYIEYSMNTTVTNCKDIIKSAQGIRSLSITNNTTKKLKLMDVSSDTYVYIVLMKNSMVSLGNVTALDNVRIVYITGGSLECSGYIEAPSITISGVNSLGTSITPLNIRSEQKCDISLVAKNDIYALFTNTNRNITTNDISLEIESQNGNVYFNYLINNGEYGVVNMDIVDIEANGVDIYFTPATLTQCTTINITSSSEKGTPDISASELKIHHVNGLCRMNIGTEDVPFEVLVSNKNVTLNGLQKCYLTQLEGDLKLDFEKSKMTFFKNEAEYQEWLAGRTPEYEYVLVVNVDDSLHISSLAASTGNDYSALAYWDKVVLNAGKDLEIDNGDCMAISLDISCKNNLIINGTLDMHRYVNDIVLDLTGEAYIENINKIGVLDITAMGSITIDGDVYVNEKLSLNSLTYYVYVNGKIMQDTVGSIYGAKNVTITAADDVTIGAINPYSRYNLTSLFGNIMINDSYNPSYVSNTSSKLIDAEALNGSIVIYGNDTYYVNAALGGSIKLRAKDDIYYYAKPVGDDVEYGNILFKLLIDDIFDISSAIGNVYIGNIDIQNTNNNITMYPGAIMSFNNDVYINSINVDRLLAKVTSTKNLTIGALTGGNGHYTINADGCVDIKSFETQNGSLRITGTNVNVVNTYGGQLLKVEADDFKFNSIKDVSSIEIKAKTLNVEKDIKASSVTLNVATLRVSSITAGVVEIFSSVEAGTFDKPIVIDSKDIYYSCESCYLECPDKLIIVQRHATISTSIETEKDVVVRFDEFTLVEGITCKTLTGKINYSTIYSITADSVDIQANNAKIDSTITVTNELKVSGIAEILGSIYAKNVSLLLYQSKILSNISAEEVNLELYNNTIIEYCDIDAEVVNVTTNGSFGTKKRSIYLESTEVDLSLNQTNGDVYIAGNANINLVDFKPASGNKVIIQGDIINGKIEATSYQYYELNASYLDLEIVSDGIIYGTAIDAICDEAKLVASGEYYIDINFTASVELDIDANVNYLGLSADSNMNITGSIKAEEASIITDNCVTLKNLGIISNGNEASVVIKANSIYTEGTKNYIKCNTNNNSKIVIEAKYINEANVALAADSISINCNSVTISNSLVATKSVEIIAEDYINIPSTTNDGTKTTNLIRASKVSLTAKYIYVEAIYADDLYLDVTNKIAYDDGYYLNPTTIYGYTDNNIDLYLSINYSTDLNIKSSSDVTFTIHGFVDTYSSDVIETPIDAEILYHDYFTYTGGMLRLDMDLELTKPLVISCNGLINGIDFNNHKITGSIIIDELSTKTIILKNGSIALESDSDSPLVIINGKVELSEMNIKNSLGCAAFIINGSLSPVSNSVIEGNQAVKLILGGKLSSNDMKVVVGGTEFNYLSTTALAEKTKYATKLEFIGSLKVDGMHNVSRFIKPGMTITYDATDVLENGDTIEFNGDSTKHVYSITYEEALAKYKAEVDSNASDFGLIDITIPYKINYSDGRESSNGSITLSLYCISEGLDITAVCIGSDGSELTAYNTYVISFSGNEYLVPTIKFQNKYIDSSNYENCIEGVFTPEMFDYYFDGCKFTYYWDANKLEDPDRKILDHIVEDMTEVYRPTKYVNGKVVIELLPNTKLTNLTENIVFDNLDGELFEGPKFAYYITVSGGPEVHIINDNFTYTPEFSINYETGELNVNKINIWDYIESNESVDISEYCNVRVFVYGLQEYGEEFYITTDGTYTARVEVWYGMYETVLMLNFTVDNPTVYKITYIVNGHERVEYLNPGDDIAGFAYDFIGYTFDGWYCDGVLFEDNLAKFESTFEGELKYYAISDMTFEARYTEGYPEGTETVTIAVVTGLSSTVIDSETQASTVVINNKEIKYLTIRNQPSQIYYAPEIEGYTFSHWEWASESADESWSFEAFNSDSDYEFLSQEMAYRLVYVPNDVVINLYGLDVTKKYDEKVKLVSFPLENQQFAGWLVDGELVSTELTYTFIVKEYVEIEALYVGFVTITVQKWDACTAITAPEGESREFTRDELAERTFIGWYFDGELVSTLDTIEMVFEESGILEARYVATEYSVTVNTTDGITATGSDKASHFADYVVLLATSGCKKITEEVITIAIGGEEYDSFEFDEDNRIITIPMDDITGNIIITVSMNIHSISKHEAVAESCTTDGNIEYYTCECGKYYSDSEGTNEITYKDTIIASHHTLAHVDEASATCTTNGTKEYDYCSVCEKKFVDGAEATDQQLVIKAHHSFGEFVEEKKSTCTEQGAPAHYECSECHKYFTKEGFEILDPLYPLVDHELEDLEYQAETCDIDGHYAHTQCKNCDYCLVDGELVTLESVTIKAHHTLVDVEAVAEGCTTDGNIAHKHCTVCGKNFVDGVEVTDVVIAAHHTLVDVEAMAEGCTTAGNIAHKHCSVCGKNFVDGVEVTDVVVSAHHTLVDVEAVAESCTTAGNIAHKHCTVCGKNYVDGEEVENVVIAAHHTLVDVEAVAEGCTTAGNIAHKHCTICGKNFVDGEEAENVAINAHHTLTHVVGVKATYTTEGVVDHYKCSVCGKFFDAEGKELTSVVIPMLEYPVKDNEVKNEVTANELESGVDLSKIIEQASKSSLPVVITSGSYSITFDSNAVAAIKNSNGVLSMNVEKNSSEYKNSLLTFELSLSNASSFGDGYVTVETELITELAKNECISVYYVAADGTRTKVTSSYENNKLSFTTNHFSTYIVVVEKIHKGMSAGAIVGIILGTLFLLLATAYVLGYFFLYRKGILDDTFFEVIYKFLPRGDELEE